MTAAPAAGQRRELLVGIDAGGSSTRARAVEHRPAGPAHFEGIVVFEGKGGPGNPVMADNETIRGSYQTALDGCPAATQVAACVSGGGAEARRAQIADLLAARFPGARIRVAPDYVAAFLAAPAGTDVCVAAGTGSVVCSRGAGGGFLVSGGRGWMLGDQGGAARLGRAALEHYVADGPDVSASLAAGVAALFGDSDRRAVVRAVHAAANPAPLLASAAPLLTAAAAGGERWAAGQLAVEMGALAATTARHIGRHLAGTAAVRVALSGGVWSSAAAATALEAALRRACDRPLSVTRSLGDPLEGALRLAGSCPS